jgi:SAM-dependent methyltransferase
MKGNGTVIGIDPERTLIQKARKICKRKRILNVQFKIGNAWKIPLKNNHADLVVSHIVLSNIPRQLDAILEMKRIAKIGGRVVVIDPAKGGGQYYPNERLNELAGKFQMAFGTAIDKGWRGRFDMSSYIEDFHLKIAQLFLKAGLTDIAMNGHLSTFLLCDTRRSTEELRTHLRARLGLWKRLEKRNEHCALVGGMNEKEYRELSQRYTDYLENLIAHSTMIKKTPEVHMVSRVIVCGIKSEMKGDSVTVCKPV